MSKYDPLNAYLAQLSDHVWNADFNSIEQILGFQLPNSAFKYEAWWANQSGDGHVQSAAWQLAGWKTDEVNISTQKVRFKKVSQPLRPLPPTEWVPPLPPAGLTIAQAKAGLAAHFQVPEDSIEISIRG